MNAVAFDTLSAARELEAAGIERRQAEAIAGTVRQATIADREALATKADLVGFATKADLAGLVTKADLAGLATKADLAGLVTKADLAAVRSELATIRWSIGLLAAFMFAIGLRVFGLF